MTSSSSSPSSSYCSSNADTALMEEALINFIEKSNGTDSTFKKHDGNAEKEGNEKSGEQSPGSEVEVDSPQGENEDDEEGWISLEKETKENPSENTPAQLASMIIGYVQPETSSSISTDDVPGGHLSAAVEVNHKYPNFQVDKMDSPSPFIELHIENNAGTSNTNTTTTNNDSNDKPTVSENSPDGDKPDLKSFVATVQEMLPTPPYINDTHLHSPKTIRPEVTTKDEKTHENETEKIQLKDDEEHTHDVLPVIAPPMMGKLPVNLRAVKSKCSGCERCICCCSCHGKDSPSRRLADSGRTNARRCRQQAKTRLSNLLLATTSSVKTCWSATFGKQRRVQRESNKIDINNNSPKPGFAVFSPSSSIQNSSSVAATTTSARAFSPPKISRRNQEKPSSFSFLYSSSSSSSSTSSPGLHLTSPSSPNNDMDAEIFDWSTTPVCTQLLYVLTAWMD